MFKKFFPIYVSLLIILIGFGSYYIYKYNKKEIPIKINISNNIDPCKSPVQSKIIETGKKWEL